MLALHGRRVNSSFCAAAVQRGLDRIKIAGVASCDEHQPGPRRCLPPRAVHRQDGAPPDELEQQAIVRLVGSVDEALGPKQRPWQVVQQLLQQAETQRAFRLVAPGLEVETVIVVVRRCVVVGGVILEMLHPEQDLDRHPAVGRFEDLRRGPDFAYPRLYVRQGGGIDQVGLVQDDQIASRTVSPLNCFLPASRKSLLQR